MLTYIAQAGAITMICGAVGACASQVTAPVSRILPPVALVVPDPAPRPPIRKGDDVRIVARKALDFGDANALRLEQARAAYQAIADEYGRP